MERDTIRQDVEELHKAADLVRAVAIRRDAQGFDTQLLNVIADAILRAMHLVASQPGARQ